MLVPVSAAAPGWSRDVHWIDLRTRGKLSCEDCRIVVHWL
ncbi:hypothetical protein L829_2255 [Mycobacteroides abscessus MAB_030201_1075]|uniref:Uncharacterized protein n=1 Tax=Mycobacteroides abscessus MAB_030201_1075 TaxID=1335410 RepID=A0A829PNB0_9MYCO|nr:hypothetical protein L835_4235 [Mycobacteroides abscessus MAB_110811_1470]ETZ88687.1 hypothetical protein L829_2255 [Mycobacteroides abscessus MAB_030201_1075]ETZ93136.1 hypothetical protein L828_4316 [Mycobacteroides abscessus MAB_030201_1061]